MTSANDSLIGAIPAHVIDEARVVQTPYDGRVAEYNVAAWLQLPGLANLPVSLLMSYMDGELRREVAVEHAKVGAQGKVLMSGIARLPVQQKIRQLTVVLRSAVPARGLIVEELFVQAVEPATTKLQQARG